MAVGLDGNIVFGPHSTLPSLHEARNTQTETETEASDTNGGFLFDQPIVTPKTTLGRIDPALRNFIDIRLEAEQSGLPRVVTYDSPAPHEIDDGVIVKQLPRHKETYQVRVCIADTSPLYANPSLLRRIHERVEARYWQDDRGKSRYEPMLPQDVIWNYQLREGRERGAMVVSFFVGEDLPPTDTEISFERVRVARNAVFNQLSAQSMPDGSYQDHAQAAEFIRSHLQFQTSGRIGRIASGEKGHGKGATHVAAFMIAASHLWGRMKAEEGRAGIFKTYQRMKPGGPPTRAIYSLEPGMHEGLGLDVFCPVTSPLRKLGDFVELHDMRQRDLGLPQTEQDIAELSAVVDRLNGAVEKVA